jgi:broad specificity phosphatase PhoE
MVYQLYVFRHAETKDNLREIFSGWRDSKLTLKGLSQAREIKEQLKECQIDYAFTSHLPRALKTLEIVLENHPPIPIFTDDRLVERCYGRFQGKSKRTIANQNPEFYSQIHRSYEYVPSEGESLKMVEKRVLSFLEQLMAWHTYNPGNVAVSCHNNSIRAIRRVFENLNVEQMLQLESPQNHAMIYDLALPESNPGKQKVTRRQLGWKNIMIPQQVKLTTDPLNPLKIFYS